MNELAELEQAERIKTWCREYGVGILLGILFAILLSVGWHYWSEARDNKAVNASTVYENLLSATALKDNANTVESYAKDLLQNYPQTPYAALAALQLAKEAVKQHKLSEAEAKLTWVVQHGTNDNLHALARIRLARVLLAENQPQRALKTLDANGPNDFYQPLLFEAKGDIFLHLGDPSKALKNYQLAKEAFSENALDQSLLSMKINNLIKSN